MPVAGDAVRDSIPSALDAVVMRHGHRVAVDAAGARVTYAELDRLANGVAHGLVRDGVRGPLAMLSPLEPPSIVAMLGALKAGRMVAPLDPRDPPDRVRQLLEQTGAARVWLPSEMPGWNDARDDAPAVAVAPDAFGIVYLTSGSTGRPRGVVRTHEQLAYAATAHGLTSEDGFGLILPLAFAGSLQAVFGPLLTGATLRLFDAAAHGVASLAAWLPEAGVTVFQTAPSALRALAIELDRRACSVPSVRMVIVGGEPCEGRHLDVARRVLPAATIVNHYGASEAGFLAVSRIAPGTPLDAGPLVFDRLYPGQTVDIVDEEGRPVRAGEAGTIRVRSRNVVPGYWTASGLDASRFVDHGDGVREFHLADRARLYADGRLELVGRDDLRVKIHGQAVDLQAVERELGRLPGVEEAVVSAPVGRHGDVRLVAHVRARLPGDVSTRGLRIALADRLPPYQIPSAIYRVEAVPRTPSGKIDRELLRRTAAEALETAHAYVPPRDATEEAIAGLVADALALDRVGADDDVFDLGADSFSMTSLVAAVNARLGVDLTARDMLEAPTVRLLAARARAAGSGPGQIVIPLWHEGPGAPFFCVAGGGGGGTLAARRLGRRLRRPTYSFVARGFERRERPDRTVPRMAARYVAAMREIQPHGPYLLGGLSFGGLVAFEMARQLERGGETVALLTLIDPVSRARWDVATAAGRADLRQRLRKPEAPPFARRAARWVWRRLRHGYERASAGLVARALPDQYSAFFRLHNHMARRYRLAPYPGACLLLRTREWQTYDRLDYTRVLTGPLDVREVPGSHLSMLAEPNISTLAAAIRDGLGRVERS